MATLGLSAADREAIEAFQRDVIEPSMTELVILDFWAEWCGPCKTLGPVLDKVAAAYADRGVRLVKIDVDANKLIATQFRVQSIPTVYAIFQGQPVADLTPARTEAQISRALDQLLAQLPVQPSGAQPAQDVAPLVAMGEEILESGDAERALSIFEQLADMAPDHPGVLAGRARALIQLQRLDEAEALLGAVDAAERDQAIARARAALSLARSVHPVGDLQGLLARLDANPDDHEARFELASGNVASGNLDEAADALLEIIRRDRQWNGGAARDTLLKLFESVGLEDPWVAAQRRRLSTMLFS